MIRRPSSKYSYAVLSPSPGSSVKCSIDPRIALGLTRPVPASTVAGGVLTVDKIFITATSLLQDSFRLAA
jgi:hypothetical protein